MRDEDDGARVAPPGTSRASAMASMSRWLVGSSSSSRSGCATSARASSTRRRQPPDSVSTAASAGRREARQHRARPAARGASRRAPRARAAGGRAARAAPACCLVGHQHRRVVIAGHQIAQVAETLGHDVEDRTAVGERHVLIEPGRSHARLASRSCRRPAPARRSRSAAAWTCPLPLRPITATRSPGSICRLASSRSGRWPKAIETWSATTSGMSRDGARTRARGRW